MVLCIGCWLDVEMWAWLSSVCRWVWAQGAGFKSTTLTCIEFCESLPGSRSELLHDGLSLFLWHVSMHRRHGEVRLPHLLRQPVHLKTDIKQTWDPLLFLHVMQLCLNKWLSSITDKLDYKSIHYQSHDLQKSF